MQDKLNIYFQPIKTNLNVLPLPFQRSSAWCLLLEAARWTAELRCPLVFRWKQTGPAFVSDLHLEHNPPRSLTTVKLQKKCVSV